MATYAELYQLAQESSTLRQKIVAACQDYAATVLAEVTPVTARVDWAKAVIDSPSAADALMWSVLVANKANTVAQINSATDAAILTAVGNAVTARYGAAA